MAVLFPLLAAFLQLNLWSILPPLTWLLFYPAVFLSAWVSGMVGGLLSTCLAALLGVYIFVAPQWSFDVADFRFYYSMGIFIIMGGLFSLVFERLHRSTAELKHIQSLELESNQQRLNLALLSANAGTWEWNLQTSRLEWSESLWLLFGLVPHSCVPSYTLWLSNVHPDQRAEVEVKLNYALENCTEVSLEWRTTELFEGNERWLMSRGQPEINSEGKLLVFRGVIVDISERKLLEVELQSYRENLEVLVDERTAELKQAREQAERLTEVKSTFLSNMSHEIRTPLNAVLGFCYLLEQQPIDDEARYLVSKINSAGRSLLAIINDILDFSKIEAGYLELESVPFRLSEVLDHLAALMSTSASYKNLELLITPQVEVDSLIGDGMRLQQVLVNLISNAIKFTEEGDVELRVTIDSEQQDFIQLRFSVRDTGIGISSEQQEDLFLAFTQADTSISRRFGGTGLGLAICQQLVSLMGGELHLNSTVGIGSEFWFVLPLQRNYDLLDEQVTLTDLHLLIVDDNSHAREALISTALNLGWHAESVDSGQAAILHTMERQGSQKPYDVLLVDWKMPGLDGLATAQVLRKLMPDSQQEHGWSPIILMVTAYSREKLRSLSASHNVDALLNKPVTPSALYNAVARVLWQRKQEGLPPLLQASQNKSCRLPGVRILVVDDSDINREVAQRILKADGAVVSLANDGQEALEWLSVHADVVDIILMDIQMPRMDGYAATRHIRQNPLWADLPIVALTAGAFKNLNDAALDAGMNDFVAKPFNVPQLMVKIQHWTGCNPECSGFDPQSHDGDFAKRITAALPARSGAFAHDYPGINLKAGLKSWGQVDVYQSYLSLFVSEYREAGTKIAMDVQQGKQDDAAALVHKLKGAAQSLAVDTVAVLTIDLETALNNSESVIYPAFALQTALDEVSTSLANLLKTQALSETIKTVSSVGVYPDEIEALLVQLLNALDQNNPGQADPLLLTLEKRLGTEPVASVKAQLRDFNFPEAKMLTLVLRQQVKLLLSE